MMTPEKHQLQEHKKTTSSGLKNEEKYAEEEKL
ncbi:unnamed protein product [Lathyrus oleraceus]